LLDRTSRVKAFPGRAVADRGAGPDPAAVDADLIRAAEDATTQALRPLMGRSPDLVLTFVCAPEVDDVSGALERVAEFSGAGATLGCSAGGVIGAGRGVELTSAVSVWAAVLPDTRLRTFHLEVLRSSESIAVVGMPPQRADDRVAILLPDPYSFPIDAFVEQSNQALPGLTLSGGLATGLRGAGSTRLLVDGLVHERGAVGVVLGGDVPVRALVSQGARPVGPAMTVTAAEGNRVLELAGVPAVSKLEEIVASLDPADQALVSEGLQLGIAMDEYVDEHGAGDFLVRAVVGVDPDRSALVVGDVVEVGRTVRFQVRDADAADADLTSVLAQFRASRALDPVEGALLFSCNGRGADLFASADHDVAAVSAGLAAPGVAGFFAAGEIGPVGGRNQLHGLTASILAFGAAPL
jgi:small ligand-binding sensory domain FIST